MDTYNLFEFFTHLLFMASLAYYLLSNLQWYSYKIDRVIFHHYKPHWHIIYFVIPLVMYLLLDYLFYFYFYIAYIPSLILWGYRLDKKLVFTSRIYRFLAILAVFTLLGNILCVYLFECALYPVLMPFVFAYIISSVIESILLKKYTEVAVDKLASMKNLKIICITGSYGKTSIKNYIYQLLENDFRVYATKRSVNTFTGIVSDINNDLPQNTQIYITEAGARAKGDIGEIANLLKHQYAVIGKIGEQHIEYFKTLQNIIDTKLEILNTPNLIKGFSYKDNPFTLKNENIILYPQEIRDVNATLEGLSFELFIDGEFHRFECDILGAFNVINIAASIYVALELGISIESIKEKIKQLKPIQHRLQKIESKHKIIIDDSFNGNLEGMLEGVRIASLHHGRKVIVTPGIIESDEASNKKLAESINNVFDIAIITGGKNTNILKQYITKPQKIILKDKSQMQNVLKAATKEGDLILFANDAPSYI